MKLVTFQTKKALRELILNGFLECKKEHINIEKMGLTYGWVLEKMNNAIPNDDNSRYPLWAWIKFKRGICPPKHKGAPIKGFEVKITFNKSEKEVFVTDFRRYSFVLNNLYIPDNKKDQALFEKKLASYKITKEELKCYVRSDKVNKSRSDDNYFTMCDEIRKSFDKCITSDSDVLQGCVWRINFDEVEQIEILNDDNYQYGSFNYIRSNGKRFDWQSDFYRKLK